MHPFTALAAGGFMLTRSRILTAALALFFALPTLVLAQSAPTNAPRKIALRAAHLIDAKSNDVLSDGVVIVEGDKIVAVGSKLPIPAGAQVIDLGDATLLPGLIDSHTHLLSEMDGTNATLQDVEMLRIVATQTTAERALLGAKLGREDLEAGITTVRDLGNSGVSGDVALRDAINRGWLPGPRIVASTRALAAQGGQFGHLIPEAQSIIEQEYVTVHGPESARQAVRQAFYDGADCIKVIVNGTPAPVTLDEMKAIVDEAHSMGRKVAAHAIGDRATRIAAEAGADSIEHAYVVPDDVLKMMAEKHIYLVPTDGTTDDFALMIFGKKTPSSVERAKFDKEFAPFLSGSRDRLQRAKKFGVPIAAGSDMYLTMGDLNRGQASLSVYNAYAADGMTPMEIILAATRNNADLLGLAKELGTLEPGKQADIIAVPGDASKDYKALQHAKFVMKGGEIYRQDK